MVGLALVGMLYLPHRHYRHPGQGVWLEGGSSNIGSQPGFRRPDGGSRRPAAAFSCTLTPQPPALERAGRGRMLLI